MIPTAVAKFAAAILCYTMKKKNKLTTENQDTDKLGKLWSERKAFGQKWSATLYL